MSVSLGRFFPPLLLLLLLPLGRYLWWQFEISVYETATHTWQRKKKRVKHREEKKKKVCTEQKTLIKKRPIDFQYTQCCAGLPVQSLVYMIKYYFPFFLCVFIFCCLGIYCPEHEKNWNMCNALPITLNSGKVCIRFANNVFHHSSDAFSPEWTQSTIRIYMGQHRARAPRNNIQRSIGTFCACQTDQSGGELKRICFCIAFICKRYSHAHFCQPLFELWISN